MASRREVKTIRGALARAVKAARDANRIGPADEVQVLIADRLAGLADRAEGPDFVRAVAEFQRAVDRLPLEEPPAPVSGGSGDLHDFVNGGRARVLELLDRPPAVGDSAHA